MPSTTAGGAGTGLDEPGVGTSRRAALDKSIVLVGLMGAGKTSVGRRLARLLDAPFADADDEIVAAAGMTIPHIFEAYGEREFRDLERRVVARLLEGPPMVLALGGGAFVDADTRALVRERGRSLWLRADLDTLVARTARRRGVRPLLMEGEPRVVLERLMRERYPLYAEADHAIETGEAPPEQLAAQIRQMLLEETT